MFNLVCKATGTQIIKKRLNVRFSEEKSKKRFEKEGNEIIVYDK